MTTSYPVSTIAKLFGLTERRMQQLAHDGIIPKPEKNQYELVGSVRAYIRKSLGGPAAGVQMDDAGNRLMKMQPSMIFDNLLPGEEVGMIDSNRPNSMLEQFRNSQLRAVRGYGHAIRPVKSAAKRD